MTIATLNEVTTVDVTVTATEAKARLAELVNRVRYSGDRVWIIRRGKPVAVLVAPEALGEQPDQSRTRSSETRVSTRQDIEEMVKAGKLHPLMRVFGAWADDDSTIDITEMIYALRRGSAARSVEF